MSLILTNISKTFTARAHTLWGKPKIISAVKNISLTIESGTSLGIVGESGSGKTTLAKILAGFMTPDSGTATLDGMDLTQLPRQKRAKAVQMVFQDPFASLNPKLLLGSQLKEALPVYDKNECDDRMESLMSAVGLSADYLKRYPHQLSGGQRQRFAIARALAPKPQLLITDEPVSSLDLSVQAQIINLLNSLRAAHKFTFLTISHDLTVISNLCERTIVMNHGDIVEDGEVEQILQNPKSPYTANLVAATPQI